jgi:hypothetical protein
MIRPECARELPQRFLQRELSLAGLPFCQERTPERTVGVAAQHAERIAREYFFQLHQRES